MIINKKVKLYGSLLSVLVASTGAMAFAPQAINADSSGNLSGNVSNSTFAIRRVDGLTVGSNTISLYVPGAKNYPGTIYAIGVQRPDQSSYMWWSKGINESNNGTLFTVSFTNPMNQAFVANPLNVGKKMTFVVQFKVNGKQYDSDAYSKPLDSTALMVSKASAKKLLDVLSPLIGDDAVQDGKNDIEDSNTVSGVASATINAIFRSFDKMTDDFNTKVDAMNNLSQSDKDNLKKQFAAKVKAAKDNLNGNNDIAAITNAFNSVKSSYDDLLNQGQKNGDSNLNDQKSKQINALDNDLKDKFDKIDKMSGLSDDLKAAAKQDLQAIHDKAVTNVNNSNNLKDIDSATTGGLNDLDTAFNKISSKHDSIRANKDLYKKTLANKAAALNTQIDNLTNLSETKKAEYKNQINKELSVGTNEIDKATDESKFTGIVSTYSDDMQKLYDGIQKNHDDGLKNEQTAATDSNSQLQKTHDALVKQLDGLGNLSVDDKKALVTKLDAALKKANDNVNNSNNSNQIKNSVNNGIDDMNSIFKDAKTNHDTDLQAYKDKKIDDLNNSANADKKVIDGLTNLTDAEKNTMKATIDAKLNTAIAQLEAANSNAAADSATANGQQDMDSYTNQQKSNHDTGLQKAKNLANQQIDSQGAAIKAQIDGLTNLSDDAKTAAKASVDKQIAAANDAINAANNQSDISKNLADNAKTLNDQFTTLKNNHDQELAAAKVSAIAEVNTKRDNTIKMLEDLTNLSSDAKQKIIDQLNSDATAAEDNINNANNNSGIVTAKNNGIQALENYYKTHKDSHDTALASDKSSAIKDLQDDAQKQIDKVNGMTNLSDLDKKSMVDRINADVDDATLKINQALTTKDAQSESANTQKMIQKYVADKDKIQKDNLRQAKALANKALDAQLKNLQDQVDDLSNLSAGDKSKIKSILAKQVAENQDNINQQNNEKDVDTSYDNQKQLLNNMFNNVKDDHDKTLQKSKDNAIDKLQNEYDSLNDEIDTLTNLSEQQRDDLRNQLTDKFKSAQDKVNQDATDDAINSDTNQSISDMDNIFNNVKSAHDTDLSNDKTSDKSKVDDAVKNAKNIINGLTNLSDETKQSLFNALDDIASETGNMIDSSLTTGDADESMQNAIDNINQYVNDQKQAHDDDLNNVKNDTNDELSNQVHDINLRIGQLTNLSPSQRQLALNTLNSMLVDSKSIINNLGTNKSINDASDISTQKMNDFFNKLKLDHDNGLDNDRKVATDSLNSDLMMLQADVDKLPNLTDAQKQQAKTDFGNILNKYKDMFSNGQTTSDIQGALDNALNEMSNLFKNNNDLNNSQNYYYYGDFNNSGNNDKTNKSNANQSSSNLKIACTNRRINKSNIFMSKPVAIYTGKSVKLYYDPSFKNRLNWKYSDKDSLNLGRPAFIVKRVMYGINGKPVAYYVQNMDYKTYNSNSYKKFGWIRATGNAIRGLYYRNASSKTLVVTSKGGINYYNNASLSGKSGHYKNGKKLHFKKIIKNGITTRILLSNGKYISGNKLLVKVM
ncbi:DUF5776 domain-containing protein [Apilactobacillus ozensis]|nr:DUF5776 domain-containing protein [Apilactobacillus ozensis]